MFDYKTERKNGLVSVIDWLSFTDVQNTDLETSLSEFGFILEEFTESEKGAFGYKKMLLHKGTTIRVLYEGNEGMGIHYDVSGSSIFELFNHFREKYMQDTPFGPGIDMDLNILKELVFHIRTLGHVTRLDLAIDDQKDPFFSVWDLYSIVKLEKRSVTKFRSCEYIEKFTTSGDLLGATFYMGNRKSDIMLRVYDKQLEQIAKGVEGAEDLSWIRWEIELKNDYADRALSQIFDGMDVGSLCFGILSNYLRIIVLDDSNKSRCSTDETWAAFLGEVKEIRLFMVQAPPTLMDKKEWVIKQVAPTIAGLVLADYGDVSWLMANFGEHAKRMNKHLQKLVTKENPDWRDMLSYYDGG